MKKLLITVVAAISLCGCASLDNVRAVDVAGMYADATKGRVGIGSINAIATPTGEESLTMIMEEDTPWLAPGTITRNFDLNVTGATTCGKIDEIVKAIFENIAKIEKPEEKPIEASDEDSADKNIAEAELDAQ